MLVPSFAKKGPFIVAKNISDKLAQNGLEVIFISLRNYEEDIAGFRCFHLGMTKVPTLACIRKLNDLIHLESVNILHCHTFWPTILGSKVNVENKVVTVHNNPWEDYSFEYGKFIGRCMSIAFVRSLNRFDKVISISLYVDALLCDVSNEQKEVAYNAVKERMVLIDSKQPDIKNLHLVVVGELIERKDISSAIMLFKKLSEVNGGGSLTIIGEGPELSKLKKLVKTFSLDDFVNFRGRLDNDSTIKIISQSDIFLFTSLSEGFGLVLIEAMMAGTVMISNNIEITKEVIGNDDLLYSNEDEFLSCVSNVVRNYTFYRKELVERYNENFTVDKMCQKYLNIYSDLH
jgi:glycosyltransferase involved in cell wall biosynthesis